LSSPSQNILIVSNDSSARGQLEQALSSLGVQLNIAEDGLFALTVLERQPADVVICMADLGDMSGQELYEMIREDHTLAKTSFVLLSGANAQLLGRGHDIQIPQDISAIDAVSFVQGLLKKRTRAALDSEKLQQTQGKMLPLGRTNPESLRASQFGGTLEHFSLFDLLMLLTQTHKSGQLFLQINQMHAMVLVDRGDVIMAEYGNHIGETALIQIFLDSDRFAESTFSFQAYEGGMPAELVGARNINNPADQLLLNIAIALDQRKSSDATLPGSLR
jgi:CheY-like chemotaxis protein